MALIVLKRNPNAAAESVARSRAIHNAPRLDFDRARTRYCCRIACLILDRTCHVRLKTGPAIRLASSRSPGSCAADNEYDNDNNCGRGKCYPHLPVLMPRLLPKASPDQLFRPIGRTLRGDQARRCLRSLIYMSRGYLKRIGRVCLAWTGKRIKDSLARHWTNRGGLRDMRPCFPPFGLGSRSRRLHPVLPVRRRQGPVNGRYPSGRRGPALRRLRPGRRGVEAVDHTPRIDPAVERLVTPIRLTAAGAPSQRAEA